MIRNHSYGNLRILISSLIALYFVVSPFVPSEKSLSAHRTGPVASPSWAKPEFHKDREEYEWMISHDPATGRVPFNARNRDRLAVQAIPRVKRTLRSQTYISAGPVNIAGRVRSAAYDIGYNGTSNRLILAGGVSGGVFRSTDGGMNWTWIPTPNLNSVTALAQDPRVGINPVTGKPYRDTWYAGTGELPGGSATVWGHTHHGFGVMVSDDKGLTWMPVKITQAGKEFLFDNRYDYIGKLVVNPQDGFIWVSKWGGFSQLNRKSLAEFSIQQAFEIGNGDVGGWDANDIIISKSGSKIYLAFNGQSTAVPVKFPNTTYQGIWEGENAVPIQWKKIVDSVLFNIWPAPKKYYRISIALAPSNESILYALSVNQPNGPNLIFPTGDLFKIELDMSGNKVTELSQNLPSNAANENFGGLNTSGGYNLALAVKPDDPDFVLIGGTNAYRSASGFRSKTATRLLGGFNYRNAPAGSTQGYDGDRSHPDIHGFIFRPGSSSEMIHFHDGGLSLTTQVSADTVRHQYINTGLQNTQYYAIAIDPNPGSLSFIGGTQDNGTLFYNGLSPNPKNQIRIYTGDGMTHGISKITNNTKWLLISGQGGYCLRQMVNPANNAFLSRSGLLQPKGSTSAFRTLIYLNPDNTEDLYFTGTNVLYRTTQASMVTDSTWQVLPGTKIGDNEQILCMASTRGAYDNLHNLFYGSSAGKLFRLRNPRMAPPNQIPDNITPKENGVLATGSILDIAVNPRNDDTLMVVYSNYNVKSIWWTGNANAAIPNWINIEGNLAEPSIRSCEIIVKKSGVEYFVGTTVGLYSTTMIDKSGTQWFKENENSPMEYAVISSMDHRWTDNTLVIGTHGNGTFYSQIGDAVAVTGIIAPLVITRHPESKSVCDQKPIVLEVTAQGGKGTGFQWYKNNMLIPNATEASLSITPMESAGYYCEVKDLSSTLKSNTAQITVSKSASAEISGTASINPGDSVPITITLTGTPPWKVSIGKDSTITLSSSPYTFFVKPVQTTEYTISSLSNECGIGFYFGVAKITVKNTTPLKELALNKFELFPVPASSAITFRFEKLASEKMVYRVVDSRGKIHYLQPVPELVDQGHTLNLETLPSGAYYLSILSEDKIRSVKFIKI
ncbi:MAG TPA: T9SS type A sorting domain-containing protein [Saprospiraceae bacterium]|nr:T9SS type A sorting domain-containing protein [Saprospiraceae bacterium]HNT21094.1 T9SS type A sorting domain-containing protein [Saprospiraceae bacterium]